MEEQNEDESIESIAEITYRLDKEGQIRIDILINDYDAESIEALAKICAGIKSDQIIYETVSHVRDLLISNNMAHLLVNFITTINEQSDVITKLYGSNTKEQKNNNQEPCIKPSDMM